MGFLEETIQQENITGKIVTSICFCEKRKLYLVVVAESDAKQDSRGDKKKK